MSSLNSDVPKEKLRELVEKNGDVLLTDPDRCEGLLKDHCGAHRREISALVGALHERVPLDLKSSWRTAMTPEAMRSRLVERLEENRGLAPQVAGWAVDAWSYALGVGLERTSDRIGDVANLAAVGQAEKGDATPSGQTAASDRERLTMGDRNNGVTPVPLPFGLTKRKAGIGGVGLVLAAGLAFAFFRPTPPKPVPAPVPVVDPQRQTPAPAPVVDPQRQTPPPAVDPQRSKVLAKQDSEPAKPLPPEPERPAVLAAGTPITVQIDQGISSDDAVPGQAVTATLTAPLTLNGDVIMDRGASATLHVIGVDQAGKFNGRARLQLSLVRLSGGGKHLLVTTAPLSFAGPEQTVNTAKRTGIGAAAGGAVGWVAGHFGRRPKTGAAIGAASGGAIGAMTAKPVPVKIEAERVLQFRLTRPAPAKA